MKRFRSRTWIEFASSVTNWQPTQSNKNIIGLHDFHSFFQFFLQRQSRLIDFISSFFPHKYFARRYWPSWRRVIAQFYLLDWDRMRFVFIFRLAKSWNSLSDSSAFFRRPPFGHSRVFCASKQTHCKWAEKLVTRKLLIRVISQIDRVRIFLLLLIGFILFSEAMMIFDTFESMEAYVSNSDLLWVRSKSICSNFEPQTFILKLLIKLSCLSLMFSSKHCLIQ